MGDKEISKANMARRKFLQAGGVVGLGVAVGGGILKGQVSGSETREGAKEPEWRMIIDTGACKEGCDKCVSACHTENNVHEDLRWIRKAVVVKEIEGKSIRINAPMLCNQCENPPCALVCPVEATFQRPDKIVDVDKHRCIGCRYCVIGCPYDVRVFNFVENEKTLNDDINPLYPKRMHGVAESCNFCAHRIDKAKMESEEPVPACVESCPEGAMVFGDISNPNTKISKYLRKRGDVAMLKGLREDLGTKPKVLYIGL